MLIRVSGNNQCNTNMATADMNQVIRKFRDFYWGLLTDVVRHRNLSRKITTTYRRSCEQHIQTFTGYWILYGSVRKGRKLPQHQATAPFLSNEAIDVTCPAFQLVTVNVDNKRVFCIFYLSVQYIEGSNSPCTVVAV